MNNAGDYGPVKPVEEITPEEWDRVIAVHLRGAFLLTRAGASGNVRARRGRDSEYFQPVGQVGVPWGAPYAAAKAGMLGLTRVTAAEAARRGVRVNAICPGPVTETKMSKDLGNTLAAAAGSQSRSAASADSSKASCKAAGKPRTKSLRPRVFLASDQASAITGQSVNVDGGAAFF